MCAIQHCNSTMYIFDHTTYATFNMWTEWLYAVISLTYRVQHKFRNSV